jgi:soluble lytic murein transglycosylase
MYDDALNELRFARRLWGDSPAIQATTAWTNQQQARSETSTKRFDLLRSGMNAMRRAYPQFMAAGGEDLPRDVQTVIFPIAYWDLIRRHAATYDLDPYFMAALILQESTFVADIRSHANAYGLMQLMPPTAREYAKKLQMPYSSRLLVNPEANVRMGMAHFADQLKKFGQPHLVLASYNAGDRPVREWIATRGPIDQDEFIDDIPYPETQGYVKKILGMAEDFRRIYGTDASVVASFDKTPFSSVSTIQPAPTTAQVRPAPKRPAVRKPAPAPKKPAASSRPRSGAARKR